MRRSLLVVAATLLSLTACSLSGPGPATGPAPRVPTSSTTTSPSGSVASSSPAEGRPLRPVPDVSVPGLTPAPSAPGLTGYTEQRLNWQPCGEPVQCAQVRAPLDWSAPQARALTLTLGRIPATASPRLGSLFINPGGPGGSGLEYLRYFRRDGLERYDIVGWDPRGVGRSTPVRCSDGPTLDRLFSIDASPDNAGETAALERAVTGFGRDCLRRSGALLEHVSTADTVRDLDLLRGLVGDSQLHYFGSSYGTQIGAEYAQAFPQHTGRVVLDGAVDLGEDSSTQQLQGFELALHHFARWCAAQRCRLGSSEPAVLATINRLLQSLDATPLPAAQGRRLTQQLGISGVLYPLYGGTEGWPPLQTALELAVVDRDGRGLLALADASNDRSENGRYGQLVAAFPAIRCRDSQDVSVPAAQRAAAALLRKAPVTGPYAGLDLFCPLWPVPPAPPSPPVDAAGVDTPIVIIGTTGDPATPYVWAKEMNRQLRSSVLITYAGEGHLAYRKSECVQKLVQGYLLDGRVPPADSRC